MIALVMALLLSLLAYLLLRVTPATHSEPEAVPVAPKSEAQTQPQNQAGQAFNAYSLRVIR